jgi:hypothetical protein
LIHSLTGLLALDTIRQDRRRLLKSYTRHRMAGIGALRAGYSTPRTV